MAITKPYKVSPFASMKKLNCPWLDDVKARTLARITDFKKFIENEAEADHLSMMADESYVYERFQYNVEHGLKYSLLQNLKYFALQFRIKILHDMIGEWKFTDCDVDMYNYFHTTDLFKDMKTATVSTKLRYIGGEAPNIYAHDDTCNWIVHVGKEDEFYSNFFYQEIVLINDIVRNVKGNPLIMPDRSFFDGGHLHEGLNLKNLMDFEEYKDLTV